jgi:undecaprenyl-diphosphatase
MRVELQHKLLDLDSKYTKSLQIADQPGPLRTLAVICAHSGDSWFWILGLGLLWWLGTDYWKARAAGMMIGVLATAVVVLIIKFTVRRKRPDGEWGNIYRITDPHSFPSGHAARAAMLAVMAIGLGPPWFGFTLFLWAPLVILARVAMGLHYLSDVLIGALLGIFIGLIMLAIIPQLAFLL